MSTESISRPKGGGCYVLGCSKNERLRIREPGPDLMGKSFTRQELYDLVWSQPMKSLAGTVGVSDVALAKACRNANIPVPERGYWARVKAGKRVPRRPELPLRFPGASDEVAIGMSRWSWGHQPPDLDSPLPPPPVFDEAIEAVRDRVRKMVGRITCSRGFVPAHPLIRKILAQEEERRANYAMKKYSWDAPRFDSVADQRKLRIINTIFLAAHRVGCSASIGTSKYEQKLEGASVRVGNHSVEFSILEADTNRMGGRGKSEKLKLKINVHSDSLNHSGVWVDNNDQKIESCVGDAVVELIVAAEISYRAQSQSYHHWLIERRAALIEEDRKRRLEQERLAREQAKKLEQDRINKLLEQAKSLREATSIRSFVDQVRNRASDIPAQPGQIEAWCEWALSQADRVDPLLNGSVILAINELHMAQKPGDQDTSS